MLIFTIKNQKLTLLKEKAFQLEKQLQQLVEANLELVFGWKLVATEFNLESFYLDSLAFDPETNSFKIIEYKRDSSKSVVDQGFAYLAAVNNHQADCVLAYNERFNESRSKKDFDWKQVRVIFVASKFNAHQKGAIKFKDMPIELWEATMFGDYLLAFNNLGNEGSSASIQSIKNPVIERVSQDVKVVGLDDHLAKMNELQRELFESIQEHALTYTGVKEKVTASYIAYNLWNVNFIYLKPYKGGLSIDIRFTNPQLNRLKISQNKVRGWDTTPSWNTSIENSSELPYLFDYMDQSYNYYQSRKNPS